MSPFTRVTAAVLLGAMLAGCGVDASTPRPTAAAARSEAIAAQAAASKDAQAKKLIASYQGVKGATAAAIKRRLALIDKIGETDSDAAAAFLAGELDRVDAEPEPVQDKLIPAIVSALAELDEVDLAPRQHHEGGEVILNADGTEAKKRKRRFNVWDIIRGYFKKKKRKSGGGGGPAPAPPAPPAM